MADPFDPDRDRGMLTAKDREFLTKGGTAENKNTERQKWFRIRDRLRNGIIDFSAFFEKMDDEQRNKTLTDLKNDDPKTVRESSGVDYDFSHPTGLSDGIRDAVALFYLAFLDNNPTEGHEMFEAMIELAVKRAIERDGGVVKVDVDISKTPVGDDPGDLVEKWITAMMPWSESGDDLPGDLDVSELGLELIRSGHIDPPEEGGDNLPDLPEDDEE